MTSRTLLLDIVERSVEVGVMVAGRVPAQTSRRVSTHNLRRTESPQTDLLSS
jgi:hypothetical protein